MKFGTLTHVCVTTLWENKSEDELLDCLVEAYQNLGYDYVENIHKNDRRHEDGTDIECQGFGETIHIQAKMKPRQGDIAQLYKLAASTSDKKIYVYVKRPTRPFKEHIRKMDGVIDFWDSEKLHDFLITNRCQLYLRYLFLDNELVRNICEIIIRIFSHWKIDSMPLDNSILDDWWSLKDRAVKLHANLEHLELYWKDEILSKDCHNPSVLKNLLDKIFLSFAIINRNSAQDLLSLIEKLEDKRPSVLSFYVNRVLESSSWIGMHQLKDEIDNTKDAMNRIHEWVLPSEKKVSEYSLIYKYLSDLHQAGMAIEDGVDFVFRDFYSEIRS